MKKLRLFLVTVSLLALERGKFKATTLPFARVAPRHAHLWITFGIFDKNILFLFYVSRLFFFYHLIFVFLFWLHGE